jgi:hypothetical protein
MMEALNSSETSVLTRSTRRNIPEDAIIHSHRRENLKSDTFIKEVYLSLRSFDVCLSRQQNPFRVPARIFTNLDGYVMAPGAISTPDFVKSLA